MKGQELRHLSHMEGSVLLAWFSLRNIGVSACWGATSTAPMLLHPICSRAQQYPFLNALQASCKPSWQLWSTALAVGWPSSGHVILTIIHVVRVGLGVVVLVAIGNQAVVGSKDVDAMVHNVPIELVLVQTDSDLFVLSPGWGMTVAANQIKKPMIQITNKQMLYGPRRHPLYKTEVSFAYWPWPSPT